MDIEKIINKLRQIGDDRSTSAMLAIEYIRNEKTKAEQERDQYELDNANLKTCIEDLEHDLESLRAQLKAAQAQEPILHQVRMGLSHVACFRSKDAAQECVDEENKRHTLSGSWANYTVHPLYATPIPAQQSPAVAVPDNFISLIAAIKQYSNGDIISVPDNIQTEEQFFDWLSTPSPSPRITEQDAREIIDDYIGFCDGKRLKPQNSVVIGMYMKNEFSALLDKLNNR